MKTERVVALVLFCCVFAFYLFLTVLREGHIAPVAMWSLSDLLQVLAVGVCVPVLIMLIGWYARGI